VRLFIGVRLSEDLCARIVRDTAHVRSSVPDVRWTNADALHITLRFLGEVAEENVAAIRSALDACASQRAPFIFRTGGVGAFPRMSRAQVLFMGVEDAGATSELVACLDAALEPLGFPPEQRAFAPHVTLGRAKKRRGVRLSEPAAAGVTIDAAMRVDRVELIRSHLGAGPARYEVLHAAMLQERTGI